MEELDQMTRQTLLEMYKYNMSLEHKSSQKRISRSLYNHIQRYPLHRRKRDIRANMEDNNPQVGKSDSSIGFTLVSMISDSFLYNYAKTPSITFMAKFLDLKSIQLLWIQSKS